MPYPGPFDPSPVFRLSPHPPGAPKNPDVPPEPEPPPAYVPRELYGPFFSEARASRGYRVRSEGVWQAARDEYVAGEAAETVCARYDLGLSAFRQRARREGWRRSDAEDPAAGGGADSPAYPPPYPPEPEAAPLTEEMADLAWRSAAQAIRRGRVYEARAWMKLRQALQEEVRREASAKRQADWQAGKPDAQLDAMKATRDAAVARTMAILDRLPGGKAAGGREDKDLDDEDCEDEGDGDGFDKAHDADSAPDDTPAGDGIRGGAEARLHGLHPEDAVQSGSRSRPPNRPSGKAHKRLAPPGRGRDPVLSDSDGPGG